MRVVTQAMSQSARIRHNLASSFHCCLQIIQVNLTSENPQPLAPGTKVDYTYSVQWTPTTVHFNRRFERYLDYNFFEHQVSRQPLAMHVPVGQGQLSLQSAAGWQL